MRLGLNLGYMVAADDPAGQLRLTRHAEELGFDVVWAAEAYGSDSPTVLAWLAGQTTRIDLGAAVMQIPGRTPAMTAMTAASLDVLSGGRFRLGLGVSGPQVSEGWHGVRFARPLERTREYLDVVTTALAGGTVRYEGRHHQLPLPDGPGKALRLMMRPVSEHVPVYLAAVGPKNLRLAGERADGWLAVFYTAEHAAEQLAEIAAGRESVGLGMDGFDVVPTFPLVVGDDVASCVDPVRGYAALYLGGMGSREQNFYNQLAVRMGYGEEAALVQDLYLDRRHREAAAAVPAEFVDATSLLGDRARLTDRLAALRDSGVTTATVTPFARDLDARCDALTVLAEAHAAL
ncbi:LLM class F420-dependent oxidoreductase [Auraticoccus monumenti]|uniref:Probable F420-dependent oxidoreductase, Rv3520c family n=1 Tax=Auraticoccus monumenti TaxID=675864 RepID=A0A1G7CZE5_9ACTN|nr:LLM class F420-dependent oxidoreductase [Auraticoccus monumenti]SDE44814.1 probable F420-dependent oxidoreductase, Rv3520c family [Auraticoccus monumenti]